MLTPEEHALMGTWGLRGSYQPEAIAALFLARRGICVVPAGGGKTIVAARALELCLRRSEGPRRALWLCHTREQLDQAEKALALIPFRDCRPGLEIAISCYAGMRPDNPFLAGVHYLIVDECHHAAAPSVAAIIDACRGAKRVWGLTATPERADEEQLERGIEEIIGPILYRCPRQELEREGHLTAAIVHFLAPNVRRSIQEACEPSAEETDKAFKANYWQVKAKGRDAQDVRDEARARAVFRKALDLGIFSNPQRDAAIVTAAVRHIIGCDSVLVIVGKKEHGKALQAAIKAGPIETQGVEFVESKTAKKKRAAIIEGFRDGSVSCLIATSLADEGMDCPRANVLIQAAGGKSEGRAEQRTGRVLRAFQGKERGIVIDFFDHQHSMLEAQSKKRAAAYRKLGYEVVMDWRMERAAKTSSFAPAFL